MDFSKTGYEMFFKPYQVLALRYLWTIQNGAKSLEVWDHVKTRVEGSISRASIINSLNAMVDNGILDYEERTGKGGHHRVYRHKYSETDLREYLIKHFIEKLLKEFPEETRRALSRLG
ncbi:hypothetical protein KJ885_06395 [Patescibacteria group bacterium]|nr:hypothetical protein [Patescibacteria group bacterium]